MEYSAEDLEVARVLVMLPRLVWEADHGPPCTHSLRWGARKRRSAGGDDPQEPPHARPPAAAPPPPRPPPLLHPPVPPAAAEKVSKKHSRAAAAAAHAVPGSGTPGKAPPFLPRLAPLPKAARPGAHQEQPSRAVAAEPPEEATAALGTSSPETPLDFYPSAEEPDAKAKAEARPPDAGSAPAKKPKLKHEQLSKQADQLNRTGTELQKEAAEIRNRLEALKGRNSELIELRIKLEREAEHHREQETDQHLHRRSCLDLLPRGPVQCISAAHGPDHAHPQPQQQHHHHYQQAWPQHWVNNHIVFHQAASGFSIHPSPAAENQRWNWAAPQTWSADGERKVPDLNSSADTDFGLESSQRQQQQGNYYHHQQQQPEHRKSLPEVQRAARKKRIEMIHKRRNAAGAAACGASVKMTTFR